MSWSTSDGPSRDSGKPQGRTQRANRAKPTQTQGNHRAHKASRSGQAGSLTRTARHHKELASVLTEPTWIRFDSIQYELAQGHTRRAAHGWRRPWRYISIRSRLGWPMDGYVSLCLLPELASCMVSCSPARSAVAAPPANIPLQLLPIASKAAGACTGAAASIAA